MGPGLGGGISLNPSNDERRQKRLARNRESARQSRRRKKQYLELLEEKVAQLSEQIEGLRRVHLEDSERALRELRDKHIHKLADTLHAEPDPNRPEQAWLDERDEKVSYVSQSNLSQLSRGALMSPPGPIRSSKGSPS